MKAIDNVAKEGNFTYMLTQDLEVLYAAESENIINLIKSIRLITILISFNKAVV